MRLLAMAVVTALLSSQLTACSSGSKESADRCPAVAKHLMSLVGSQGASPGEAQIIATIERTAIDACRAEPLTKEQADCLLAARTMAAASACPDSPSWVLK